MAEHDDTLVVRFKPASLDDIPLGVMTPGQQDPLSEPGRAVLDGAGPDDADGLINPNPECKA